MFSGSDTLPTAVHTAKERDLRPLVEESARALDLDCTQQAAMAQHLHEAWFFGIRTGHAVMVETKMGQTDAAPVAARMQDQFQERMERLAEALDMTVGATVAAWNYLGRAWVAGARFWEVEIAARLIERRTGDFDEELRGIEG
jgi:hypothetical protein